MAELSIIVPTYKERRNLIPLIRSLGESLGKIDYEVVIVDDDSPDATAAMARSLAQHDPRVRIVHRIGRRGLASAAVEGMLTTSSPYLLVMDADGQHDPAIIPAMLARTKNEQLDIVVGTRNSEGGSMGEFAASRVTISNAGRKLGSFICRVPLSDPMSGFFLLTREFFHEVVHDLSCVGFKILIDILSSARREVRIREVGYTFRSRLHGESKLDILVGLEYLQLLLGKLTRGLIPTSYLLFASVGAVGICFNFALAWVLISSFGLRFGRAQIIGAIATIAVNFFLNNSLTFRSARLKGVRMLQGLVLFYLSCSVGLLSQVAIASSLERLGTAWPAATLAGIAIGSVWNYTMAFLLVWHVKKHRTQRLQHAYAQQSWLVEDSVDLSIVDSLVLRP